MARFEEELVQLTQRECDVVRLVARGRSAKETARELAIAPCTVERHVENVRLKTRTRNRAHMIAHVIREGMLPMDNSGGPILQAQLLGPELRV